MNEHKVQWGQSLKIGCVTHPRTSLPNELNIAALHVGLWELLVIAFFSVIGWNSALWHQDLQN